MIDGTKIAPPEDLTAILLGALLPEDGLLDFDPDGIIEAAEKEEAETRAHRAEVDAEKWRRKIKRDAIEEERAELEAYLSSEEGQAEAAQRFEADIIDPEDLDDPDPLIHGFIHLDTMARTFGPPKSLKSFVTLDMAACVSLGIPWQGHETRQVNVLYIVAEGARGVKHRKRAWNEKNQAEMQVIFYGKAVQIADQRQMHDLISFCVVKEIEYIVFDTQARCTVGVVENDNTEMGAIVAALDVLRQRTGACVHLVHHSVGSDDGKARGATAWDGAVDAEFIVKRDANDRSLVKLVTKFQKDSPELEPVEMRTLEVGTSLVLESDGAASGGGSSKDVAPALVSDANAFYLRVIHGFGNTSVTVSDVERDLKESGNPKARNSVKKAFGQLLSGGAVTQVGRGTAVVISEAGLVYLDQHPEDAQNQGVIPGVARHPQ